MPIDSQQPFIPLTGGQIDPQTAVVLKQFIKANGNVSVNGRSHQPSTTTIPSNQGGIPQLLDFLTNDFANGITWANNGFTIKTAGNYLVTCTVYYQTVGMQTGAAYSAGFQKNYVSGNHAFTGNSDVSAGGTSNTLAITFTDVVKLAVGDTIQFLSQTSSNATITYSSGSSGALAKV